MDRRSFLRRTAAGIGVLALDPFSLLNSPPAAAFPTPAAPAMLERKIELWTCHVQKELKAGSTIQITGNAIRGAQVSSFAGLSPLSPPGPPRFLHGHEKVTAGPLPRLVLPSVGNTGETLVVCIYGPTESVSDSEGNTWRRDQVGVHVSSA